jgi:lysophospholipase L1-like esterase
MNPTIAALNRLKRLCDERSWSCFVAIAPPAFVAHSNRLSSTFDLVGIDPSTVDPLQPNRAAIQAAQGLFPTIDLSPALIEAGTDEPMYFRFDGHWSRAGHRVVADTLTPWLAGLLTESEDNAEQ